MFSQLVQGVDRSACQAQSGERVCYDSLCLYGCSANLDAMEIDECGLHMKKSCVAGPEGDISANKFVGLEVFVISLIKAEN